ncbi:6-carboxytetrahydropterin synthase QueD [Patescibacteria group bacterium]|nr:6-carboxytetrahydropterin synthase QueD [Patescibacteria group bacterium]
MTLNKKFTFDSAHKLENYDGKCKNLHGHTYIVMVFVQGEISKENGMVIDFKILEEIVEKEVLEKLDHKYLNDIIDLPTAENTVKWIWQALEDKFQDHKIKLYKLKLWENPNSSVTYKK